MSPVLRQSTNVDNRLCLLNTGTACGSGARTGKRKYRKQPFWTTEANVEWYRKQKKLAKHIRACVLQETRRQSEERKRGKYSFTRPEFLALTLRVLRAKSSKDKIGPGTYLCATPEDGIGQSNSATTQDGHFQHIWGRLWRLTPCQPKFEGQGDDLRSHWLECLLLQAAAYRRRDSEIKVSLVNASWG